MSASVYSLRLRCVGQERDGAEFGTTVDMAKTKKQQITIDGRDVPLSNLEKVLFPDGQVRKADVIDFYARMADVLLPHLKDRPVTLKRYPNGALGDFFYEKDAPGFTPDWVETFPVPRR